MIAIRAEIDQVANGDFTVENSPLRNAPHTAAAVVSSDWDRASTRASRPPSRSTRSSRTSTSRRSDGSTALPGTAT